ncbi:DUF748 domain-containing protein [Marinobacter salinexigens]|uniref:DUF748 domain-containing protein n=1 Tax=Marinobacter salinexigens TaxID=2919747 RepID=A0A5B0VJ16_9GAMM|nr:DUF748 domain-containing protein [Marinobacter salinexigens]KAA1174263.1 DUF748 domain-containing protein [Marinobacter salinexigens]
MAESSKRSHLPRNLSIGFVVLFVLYTCAGFLILPWWLEKTLPEQLDQRMGWQAEVTDIRFNPFLLTLDTEGLSAEDSGGEKVLGFDLLHVDLNVFQLVRGIVGFEAIRLQEPYIRLDLLEGYGVNFARDWQENNPETAESDQEPVAAEESSGPPKLYFGQVAIDGGELLFRDYSQSEPAEFHITPLDLTLNDLATWPRDDRDSDYYFMAAIGNQTVEWEGDLSVTPLYSKGHLRVAGVGYETLKHFIAPYLPYDLRGGKVTLSSDYELQVADGVFLSTANGNLELDELALAISEGSDATSLTTGTLAIDKIGFDLTGMDASVGQISLDGLDVTLVRDEEGQIDWLKPLSNTDGDEAPEAPEAESSSGAGLTWSVAGIELSGARVHWLDRQPATDADLALEQVELKVGPVTHDLEEPVTYSVNASLASGGRLSVNGQATPAPFTLEAAISGADIALAAVEPYVQEGANLNIAGGTLGVDGNLDLDAQTTPLTGTFSGTAQVEDFAVGLPDDQDRLLSWQTLQLAPVEYNVNPARLEIGTVTLKQLAANVVRGPDAIHNVERIARSAGADSSEASDAGTETSSGDEPGFIFRIGQVMLENGAIGYTDRTLSPAFTTSLDELNGSVTGLSNIPPQQGKVAIKGRVDSVANLDFQGTIGTLGTEELSDLKLSMNDLSLPVLSPYFGRYLGYGVDSGKLDLDLDYKISGTRIEAENIVIMDQLALGQSVESEDAVNAPVQLGLTLLRDTDGVIEVDLPISGDLSDPEFSVGRVVMRAFVNLLVKAAASPFSMLGSIAEMAGLSGEELGMVSFSPGSVNLAEGESEKLAALADALKQRPELLLNIRGGVSPEADGLALLKESLTRGGQDLSDAQWDVARTAYLAGERELPPEALNNLATARGVAVRKMLQDTHEVPTDQLFLLDPSRNASVGDTGDVIVEFSLGAR